MPYIHFDHLGETPPKGLNLVSMSGREAISELFHYELVLEADNKDSEVKATDIIGQEISLRVDYFNLEPVSNPRYVHGVVNSFKIMDSDTSSGIRRYAVELVPSLWFLTKKSNFQIFENQKSSDIIKKVLSENGITTSLPSGKIQREHTIQYLETDYEFVTRLMSDEGFIFYFEHSKDAHKLVVKDSNQYLSSGTLDVLSEVKSWNPEYTFVSSKWDAGDYSYSEKSESLAENKKSTVKGLDNSKHTQVVTAAEVAGEGDAAALKRQAEVLTGQEDASYEVIDVTSDNAAICAGASFKVDDKDYLPSGTDSEFVVIEAVHHLDAGSRYVNNFRCIPSTFTYWTKERDPRPIVNGPMTARVVESGGDELGRIKVKFLYEGADSESRNSCWIRVAQVISGTGFGAMFTPRIDEEVVVTFINGNPDRPLISGTVYNKGHMPHKDYLGETGKPTRNGFLTTFDGKKFNELYFEDKPGDELFYVRTDNNYERLVEANDKLTIVKGDRTILIKEGNESETLDKGNKSTTLTKGNQDITLKDGNQTITLNKGDRSVTCDNGDISTESSAKNIKMKAAKNIEGKADKNIELTATSKIQLKVGGSTMTMEPSGITLKVGGNSIKIEQAGITVKGIQVKVEGSAQAEVKSPMTTVKGDGMMTVKGGVVMIN